MMTCINSRRPVSPNAMLRVMLSMWPSSHMPQASAPGGVSPLDLLAPPPCPPSLGHLHQPPYDRLKQSLLTSHKGC
jgi:hypothetical protein